MTEKRFTTFVENGSVCLNDALKVYKSVDVHYYEYLLDCMNELNNENEQLKKENENLNNVLEDFMTITNRLQSEPHNKSLPLMARDMLRLMGKNVMGDSE